MRKALLTTATLFNLVFAPSAPVAYSQSTMIDGQVTKVDVAASKITIKHGPIKKLDMDEGMTMVFRVPDPAMLNNIKAGDKIKFEPDNVNGQFTATKIEKSR